MSSKNFYRFRLLHREGDPIWKFGVYHNGFHIIEKRSVYRMSDRGNIFSHLFLYEEIRCLLHMTENVLKLMHSTGVGPSRRIEPEQRQLTIIINACIREIAEEDRRMRNVTV